MTRFRQSPNITTRLVDGEAFLISEAAITHLNPVATIIWAMLQDPLSQDDVEEILAGLYPAISKEQILSDARATLATLQRKLLVSQVKT